MRARYEFGAVVRRWQLAPRGPATVGALARHMQVDHSALRRLARTCEVIPPEEISRLAKMRTVGGYAITWSHVELLAREADPRHRARLAKAVADEELSVRGLRSRMAGRRASR